MFFGTIPVRCVTSCKETCVSLLEVTHFEHAFVNSVLVHTTCSVGKSFREDLHHVSLVWSWSATFGSYHALFLLAPMSASPSRSRAHEDVEAKALKDPYLSPEKQRARRDAAGLGDGETLTFCESCEFVSLGCFCAVAHALQALGLKKATYPFDWNRSPVEGVIQCLQRDFEGFDCGPAALPSRMIGPCEQVR